MARVPEHLIPIDLRDAAVMVGVSRNRMYALVVSGHVAGAYRNSGDRGHWRLKRADFLPWLDSFQSGNIKIPRNKRSKRQPPKKGGLAEALKSIRF